MFRRWANTVLKEYLLRGYSVNARMNQLEDKVDRRLAQHDQAIIDLKEKVDFFVQTKEPPLQGVFYDGQLWDARALVLKLVAGAKRSLILIDNWATPEVLDLFAKKRNGAILRTRKIRQLLLCRGPCMFGRWGQSAALDCSL